MVSATLTACCCLSRRGFSPAPAKYLIDFTVPHKPTVPSLFWSCYLVSVNGITNHQAPHWNPGVTDFSLALLHPSLHTPYNQFLGMLFCKYFSSCLCFLSSSRCPSPGLSVTCARAGAPSCLRASGPPQPSPHALPKTRVYSASYLQ